MTKEIEETEEKFIIRTLTPFAETVIEQQINKKELATALLNYYNPSFPIDVHSELKCNNCNTLLNYGPEKIKGKDEIYCYACGRRMKLR